MSGCKSHLCLKIPCFTKHILFVPTDFTGASSAVAVGNVEQLGAVSAHAEGDMEGPAAR